MSDFATYRPEYKGLSIKNKIVPGGPRISTIVVHLIGIVVDLLFGRSVFENNDIFWAP
jgi:hypothetical protein